MRSVLKYPALTGKPSAVKVSFSELPSPAMVNLYSYADPALSGGISPAAMDWTPGTNARRSRSCSNLAFITRCPSDRTLLESCRSFSRLRLPLPWRSCELLRDPRQPFEPLHTVSTLFARALQAQSPQRISAQLLVETVRCARTLPTAAHTHHRSGPSCKPYLHSQFFMGM